MRVLCWCLALNWCSVTGAGQAELADARVRLEEERKLLRAARQERDLTRADRDQVGVDLRVPRPWGVEP